MFSVYPSTVRRQLVVALLLLTVAYGVFLFWRGCIDPDEGRYSEIPREMVASGNWLEMRLMDFRYYEKPILGYWLTAPALAILGPYDWAARVPLLFPLFGTLLLMHGLVRRHWPHQMATPALLAMMSLAGVFVGFGLLMTDTFLIFWFTLVCVALFEAYAAGALPASRRRGLLLAALAGVFGFMTKGAVAVVLPGATLFCWLIWERRLGQLWTWWLLPAAGLFMALLAPWLWWLEQHNPGFFRYFVIEEHLSRFTGTRAIQGHPEPWWFFLALAPVMLLPWTLFAVRAVVRSWGRHDSLTRFLVCWAVVVLVFFSISSGKLMSYVLPAFPAAGLLIGRWGAGEQLDGTPRDRKLWQLGLAGPVLVIFAFLLLWCVSWFQIVPQRIPQISGLSLMLFVPIAVVLWFARRILGSFAGVALLVGGALLALALVCSPLAGLNFNVFLHINDSILYKQVAAQLKPADQIVVVWDYRPALLFYTQKPYIPFQVTNELGFGMKAEPQRRGNVATFDELRQIVRGCPGRVLIFFDPDDYGKKITLPADLQLIPTEFPQTPDTLIFELRLNPA